MRNYIDVRSYLTFELNEERTQNEIKENVVFCSVVVRGFMSLISMVVSRLIASVKLIVHKVIIIAYWFYSHTITIKVQQTNPYILKCEPHLKRCGLLCHSTNKRRRRCISFSLNLHQQMIVFFCSFQAEFLLK